eukprot:m.83572 g.83572  ORF g.83572 m.83572 type:complete len:896 (+) comp8164_c0_seq4:776-3463(+)
MILHSGKIFPPRKCAILYTPSETSRQPCKCHRFAGAVDYDLTVSTSNHFRQLLLGSKRDALRFGPVHATNIEPATMSGPALAVQREAILEHRRRLHRIQHALRCHLDDFLAHQTEEEHTLACCKCKTRRHEAGCLSSRARFNSTDNSKRKVQLMAYWRRVLGPHFPIPDSMLRTAWRHFETCECGYRPGSGSKKSRRDALCINDLHCTVVEHGRLVETLADGLRELQIPERVEAIAALIASYKEEMPASEQVALLAALCAAVRELRFSCSEGLPDSVEVDDVESDMHPGTPGGTASSDDDDTDRKKYSRKYFTPRTDRPSSKRSRSVSDATAAMMEPDSRSSDPPVDVSGKPRGKTGPRARAASHTGSMPRVPSPPPTAVPPDGSTPRSLAELGHAMEQRMPAAADVQPAQALDSVPGPDIKRSKGRRASASAAAPIPADGDNPAAPKLSAGRTPRRAATLSGSAARPSVKVGPGLSVAGGAPVPPPSSFAGRLSKSSRADGTLTGPSSSASQQMYQSHASERVLPSQHFSLGAGDDDFAASRSLGTGIAAPTSRPGVHILDNVAAALRAQNLLSLASSHLQRTRGAIDTSMPMTAQEQQLTQLRQAAIAAASLPRARTTHDQQSDQLREDQSVDAIAAQLSELYPPAGSVHSFPTDARAFPSMTSSMHSSATLLSQIGRHQGGMSAVMAVQNAAPTPAHVRSDPTSSVSSYMHSFPAYGRPLPSAARADVHRPWLASLPDQMADQQFTAALAAVPGSTPGSLTSLALQGGFAQASQPAQDISMVATPQDQDFAAQDLKDLIDTLAADGSEGPQSLYHPSQLQYSDPSQQFHHPPPQQQFYTQQDSWPTPDVLQGLTSGQARPNLPPGSSHSALYGFPRDLGPGSRGFDQGPGLS